MRTLEPARRPPGIARRPEALGSHTAALVGISAAAMAACAKVGEDVVDLELGGLHVVRAEMDELSSFQDVAVRFAVFSIVEGRYNAFERRRSVRCFAGVASSVGESPR